MIRIGRFLEANRSLIGFRKERKTFLLPVEWDRRLPDRGESAGDRSAAGAAEGAASRPGSRWTSGTPLF